MVGAKPENHEKLFHPVLKNRSGRPYVPLSGALTWIAFGEALTPDELRGQVEGEPACELDDSEKRLQRFFSGSEEQVSGVPGLGYFQDRHLGLERLEVAWRIVRDAVDREKIRMRGRYTSTYSLADAQRAEVEPLTGDKLATFSQFDVSTGGIRRRICETTNLMWQYDPTSFSREFEAFGEDQRTADGYLLVEVERDGLIRLMRMQASGTVPPNRQLNHQEVVSQAAAMREAQPGISKGAAAASIVADLPPNPRSGNRRDTRNIERIIGHLWEGEL